MNDYSKRCSKIFSFKEECTGADSLAKLDEALANAPRYGRNAAWLVLNAIALEEAQQGDTILREPAKGKLKAARLPSVDTPSTGQSNHNVQFSRSMEQAMPRVLRPNIEVQLRAKVSRGPRINWLNRLISAYLEFIATEILKIGQGAQLLQEVRFNAALCRCAIQAAKQHERTYFEKCMNCTSYHSMLRKSNANLSHIPSAPLAALCDFHRVCCPGLLDEPQSLMHEVKIPTIVKASVAASTTERGNMEPETADHSKTYFGEDVERAPMSSDLSASTVKVSAERTEGTDASVKQQCESVAGKAATCVSGWAPNMYSIIAPNYAIRVYHGICNSEGQTPISAVDKRNARADNANLPLAEPVQTQLPIKGGLAPVNSEEQRRLQQYIGKCLEPYLCKNALNLSEYTDLLCKVSQKVIEAQSGLLSEDFYKAQAPRIQRLCDKYVTYLIKTRDVCR